MLQKLRGVPLELLHLLLIDSSLTLHGRIDTYGQQTLTLALSIIKLYLINLTHEICKDPCHKVTFYRGSKPQELCMTSRDFFAAFFCIHYKVKQTLTKAFQRRISTICMIKLDALLIFFQIQNLKTRVATYVTHVLCF